MEKAKKRLKYYPHTDNNDDWDFDGSIQENSTQQEETDDGDLDADDDVSVEGNSPQQNKSVPDSSVLEELFAAWGLGNNAIGCLSNASCVQEYAKQFPPKKLHNNNTDIANKEEDKTTPHEEISISGDTKNLNGNLNNPFDNEQ